MCDRCGDERCNDPDSKWCSDILLVRYKNERDALRQKVGRMRRALRLLNKAHRVLWKVVGYRNEFHDFAVKQGTFIEFRKATEKPREVTPQEHDVLNKALRQSTREVKPCACVRPEIHGHQLLCKQGKAR